jgi:hypothetical protein
MTWAKRMTAIAAALLLAGSTTSLSPSRAAGATTPPSPPFASVTLMIRHRVFPNFRDRQRVKLDKEFVIGDTDYTGRVIRYVPDFFMDVKTRMIKSRSNEPKNPAFEVVVKQKKVPQDTSWAFLRVPPHFARTSLLSFQILRIDFADRPPVVNPDSTSGAAAPTTTPVQIQPSHGSTPGTSPH